ncbi:MAG: ABC transporter ATP-binding protein [Hyphomicrobiales bacterium]|nr:ABC transporter ATP-binding protein [Hyphomicrobiales bacterium]
MSLLELNGVTGGYGDADILHDLSLKVEPGEIVVIIGPNGAGKSTAMRAVFGLITIRAGTVVFDGEEVTGWKPNRIAARGISYVPQVDNIFPSMTVHENLEMGAFLRRDDFSGQIAKVYDLFPPLKDLRSTRAGDLSGGLRQMVAMGRALMLEPKLVLLDEPTAGLSPKYMDQIFTIVRDLNAFGVAILMVEQNAKQALKIADRGYVLATGANRFEDTGSALLANPEMAELFLGG